jgi:hypothetical protein
MIPHARHLWLDPGMRDVSAASELLKPYDARLMRCYPISTRINSVANDDEECCRLWNSPRFRIVCSCSRTSSEIQFALVVSIRQQSRRMEK